MHFLFQQKNTRFQKIVQEIKINKKMFIDPMIRIGREIQCLPYAGFFSSLNGKMHHT